MSDFDKEAEREKLRKKFADDEEKRADTQRMSELLLKGATMTNKHCDRCGDPLFRYNGQTFCSTCQAEAADSEPESTDDAQSDTGDVAGDASRPAAQVDRPTKTRSEQSSQSQPARGGTVREETADSRSQPAGEPAPTVGGEPQGSVGGDGATGGSLTEARQSLRRTVTRFARAAEETDEPRRARELLAAAREAAETLAALD
ncbi:MAG: Sjogren's syndrome/scleroderma autoantigen 1 family protein [Halohasta sp.]